MKPRQNQAFANYPPQRGQGMLFRWALGKASRSQSAGDPRRGRKAKRKGKS